MKKALAVLGVALGLASPSGAVPIQVTIPGRGFLDASFTDNRGNVVSTLPSELKFTFDSEGPIDQQIEGTFEMGNEILPLEGNPSFNRGPELSVGFCCGETGLVFTTVMGSEVFLHLEFEPFPERSAQAVADAYLSQVPINWLLDFHMGPLDGLEVDIDGSEIRGEVVPEPSAGVLGGLGVALLGWIRRSRSSGLRFLRPLAVTPGARSQPGTGSGRSEIPNKPLRFKEERRRLNQRSGTLGEIVKKLLVLLGILLWPTWALGVPIHVTITGDGFYEPHSDIVYGPPTVTTFTFDNQGPLDQVVEGVFYIDGVGIPIEGDIYVPWERYEAVISLSSEDGQLGVGGILEFERDFPERSLFWVGEAMVNENINRGSWEMYSESTGFVEIAFGWELEAVVVPEPSVAPLVLLGLATLTLARRR